MTDTGALSEAPHTVDDVLAAARSPGAAEPSEIHVRAALYAQMRREVVAGHAPVTADADGEISHLDGIPVLVDEGLPAFPGYEIHRTRPGAQPLAA
jgi:hypothetical protein